MYSFFRFYLLIYSWCEFYVWDHFGPSLNTVKALTAPHWYNPHSWKEKQIIMWSCRVRIPEYCFNCPIHFWRIKYLTADFGLLDRRADMIDTFTYILMPLYQCYCRMVSQHAAFFRGHKSSFHCKLVIHHCVLAKRSFLTVGSWQYQHCCVKIMMRQCKIFCAIKNSFCSLSRIQCNKTEIPIRKVFWGVIYNPSFVRIFAVLQIPVFTANENKTF